MSMLNEIGKMEPEKRAEFLRDRRKALLSMDVRELIIFADKYDVPGLADSAALAEVNPESAFWVIVHKARTGASDLPDWARKASRRWLHQRGHSAMDERGEKRESC